MDKGYRIRSYDYLESVDEESPWRTVCIRRGSEAVESTSIELASKKTTNGSMVSSKKLADIGKQVKFVISHSTKISLIRDVAILLTQILAVIRQKTSPTGNLLQMT